MLFIWVLFSIVWLGLGYSICLTFGCGWVFLVGFGVWADCYLVSRFVVLCLLVVWICCI